MDAFEETSSEIGRTPVSDLLGRVGKSPWYYSAGAGMD